MSTIRRKVLNQFKQLHRARLIVFEGDQRALIQARRLINDEFRKNSNITDSDEVEKLVKKAKDVENELRTNVIQAVEKQPGVFEVKVKPDTLLLENVPFKEDAIFDEYKGPKCGSSSK